MTDRMRVLWTLARPAVLALFALFTATGLAEAGHPDDRLRLAKALLVVVAFLLYAVVVNDLSDEAVDRVNLPGRPLPSGLCSRRDFVLTAVTAAAASLAAAALINRAALAVDVGGLALVAAYSLRPVRLADRGALASLVLPAGYVAVPYLVGLFAARPWLTARDLTLLAGLYVGFIGRILLKDFRDVRGDALFGKRTFLVRHGRRATCAFSAACWVAGAVLLRSPFVMVQAAAALVLLRALAQDRGARRDEWLIAAIAVVGRGMVVTIIASLSLSAWSTTARGAFLAALAAVVLGAASSMAKYGPRGCTFDLYGGRGGSGVAAVAVERVEVGAHR